MFHLFGVWMSLILLVIVTVVMRVCVCACVAVDVCMRVHLPAVISRGGGDGGPPGDVGGRAQSNSRSDLKRAGEPRYGHAVCFLVNCSSGTLNLYSSLLHFLLPLSLPFSHTLYIFHSLLPLFHFLPLMLGRLHLYESDIKNNNVALVLSLLLGWSFVDEHLLLSCLSPQPLPLPLPRPGGGG